MSTDIVGDVIGIVGVILGILGVLYGYRGWREGRQQRSKRHESELINANLIGRLNGALIMAKPILPNNEGVTAAINDCLDAIKVAAQRIEAIEKSDRPS
jgi:hypothetical protein